MTRNRPCRQTHRPCVEVVEARCLLSVANPVTPDDITDVLQAVPAESASGLGSSSTAATAQDAIIGASKARARHGVSGKGLTAAVIDTGVDYDHPAFGGGFGDGHVVVAGYDFGDKDADPMASTSPHGTAVAGIIASRDPKALGVAPGAEIVALRVFNESGRASFSRIADALQWVVDNHEQYNISVVNLSISDGKNHPDAQELYDDPANRRMLRLIDKLEDLNIPVITAAGNGFDGSQGMGYTAIIDNTISVTGADGLNRIATDAQRLGRQVGGASATDLLAPGRGVRAPWEGTSYLSLDGTSFAAPQVAGAVLLLQELHLQRFGTLPTVEQLEGWLRDSADPVRDPVTGITIGRLDIPAAAAMVPSPRPPVSTPTPTPIQTPVGSGGAGSSAGGGGSSSPNTKPAAKPSPSPTPGQGATGGGSKPTTPSGGSDGGAPVTSPGGGSQPVSPSPAPAPDPTPTPTPAPSPSPAPSESVVPPAAPEATPPVVPSPIEPGPVDSPPATDGIASDAPQDVPEVPASPDPVPPAEANDPAPPPEPSPVVADVPATEDGPSGDDLDVDVIDATIDQLVDDLGGATQPQPEAVPVPAMEDADDRPAPGKEAIDREASRSGTIHRPVVAVLLGRAWSLGLPGTPPIWGRAQFVRSARASAVAQRRALRAEAARTFPTAIPRPLAARQSAV